MVDAERCIANRVADTVVVIVGVPAGTAAEKTWGGRGETLVPPSTAKMTEAASRRKRVMQEIEEEFDDIIWEPPRKGGVLRYA